MKLIYTDNYNRELYDDRLIAENLDKINGKDIADELNGLMRDDNFYYILVEDDYVLFERDY